MFTLILLVLAYVAGFVSALFLCRRWITNSGLDAALFSVRRINRYFDRAMERLRTVTGQPEKKK